MVAGERRYRAATMAGLTDIPCFVRELTDLQVLHAQVIENLQRDDLHPLEEAEGYEKLMQQKDANGQPYTADTIAAEVSKSRSYVYAKLKLRALCAEVREAFYSGELDESTALLIARIPAQRLQIQAVKQITKQAEYDSNSSMKGDKVMSYRAARALLQREYMTELARAVFDIKDATLLDKVGACTDCENRTGNQPELFDDVNSPDVCTNTVCFGMKKAAHALAIQKDAEAKGHIVITGKAAKKIIPNPQYQSDPYPESDSGYVRLDRECPHVPGKTWEQVLKAHKLMTPAKGEDKPTVPKVLIEDTHRSAFIPAVSVETAIKALREVAGFTEAMQQAESEKKNSALSKNSSKEKQEHEQASAYRMHLFHALHNKIAAGMAQPTPHVADGLYRVLAEQHFDFFVGHYFNEDDKWLVKMYMPDLTEEDDFEESFKEYIRTKMTTQQHFLLLIDLLIANEIDVPFHVLERSPEIMCSVAEAIGIDAETIKKESLAEFKAKQKSEAAEAKKAASLAAKKAVIKTSSTPPAAAQAQTKPAPKKTKAAPAIAKAPVKPKPKAIAKAANAA